MATLLPASSRAVEITPAVEARFAAQYGEDAVGRLRGWERLMAAQGDGSDAHKRLTVNDFFNRIPWISDQEHWGKPDYWATPFEVLGTNGADCEDFSIGKYFTLAQMAVPRGRLLITYVRAVSLRETHMVLAYYPMPEADPFILDNLTDEVKRGSQRPDLVPVYSFNGDGLWMAVERGKGRLVGGAGRIAAWRGVLDRLAAEGSGLSDAQPGDPTR